MSWPIAKLGDHVSHVSSGSTPLGGASNYLACGRSMFLRSQNVHMNELRLDDVVYISDELHDKMPRSAVKKGDVLINITGASIGRVTSFDLDFENVNCNQHVCIIRPKSKDICHQYLSYFLSSDRFQSSIFSSQRGGTREALTFSQIREFEIPLPPLTEQKRIAAILDKADAIRRKRQQTIQLADEFLRAVFLDMFGDPVTNPKGWDVKPLSHGIESIESGWSANGESYPCKEGEYGVLKISAVTSGKFKPNENKYVATESIPEGKKLLFPKKGDLLFSRANTRELVAATCIVPFNQDNVFLPDKLWNIKTLQTEIIPEFLNYLIWQPRFKETLTSQATGTSGSMLNISKGKFEATDAIFPPLGLQKKFKSLYWETQALIGKLEKSLTNCEQAFSSFGQKAFSGSL